MKHFTATVAMLLMFIASALGAVNPEAPGPATELETNFEGASLRGSLWFKAPLKTASGEELSAYLNYKVYIDNVEKLSGRAYSGSSSSCDGLSVPRKGIYEFKIVFSNEYGEGEPAVLTAGIGYAPPLSPNPVANAQGNSVTVSWAGVTTDIDGVPVSDVTYRVSRVNGGSEIIVADNLSATTFTDVITDAPEGTVTPYLYNVYARANGTYSEAGASNYVPVGSINPPYSAAFDTPESMYTFTQIDGNGDGRVFDYYYNEGYIHDTSDDWIVTAPINVTSDAYYRLGVKVRARNGAMPPRFELRWGTEPTVEGLKNVALPETSCASETLQDFTATIHPETDGQIYIALHCIDSGWGMLATALSITAPIEVTLPGELVDFDAVAASGSEKKVTVSFTTPTTTMDGKPLSSVDKVEVLRDGEIIHTFPAPATGTAFTYVDTEVATDGEHTYAAIPYGSGAAGPRSEKVVFVGMNVPAAPKWARARETENPGEVCLEWEVPTTYKDGRPLDPSTLTFNVYTPVNGSDMKIQTGLTGNTTTFQIVLPDEPQLMFYFCVTAENAAGENFEPAVTEMLPYGQPYDAPYEDSFTELTTKYLYGTGTQEYYTFWDFSSDTTYPGITTYDHDNGMYGLRAQETGYYAYFFTGKINLKPLTKPALTFYVHNNAADADNTLKVIGYGSDSERELGTFRVGDLGGEGWRRVVLPLDEFAGGNVRFRFIGTTVSSCRLLLDNIRIVDRYNSDIALISVEMPERVKAGNDLNMSVSFFNEGLNDASAFTVELTADGKTLETRSFAGLATDAGANAQFTVPYSAVSPAECVYRIDIKNAGDEKVANNTTGDRKVIARFPDYPRVTDLKAVYAPERPADVTLSWSEPDRNVALEDDITESFEQAEAWTSEVEGWNFVDADQGGIFGFGTWVEVPNITVLSQQSWWVQDGDYAPLRDHFYPEYSTAAHTGSKYIAQNAVIKDEVVGKCDDWAISPRLAGTAQTVTLFARSFYEDAPETFEFRISDSGTDTSDFTLLRTVNKIPNTWTSYSFDLPEGTRYFAIRAISRDCYMLMIDDVCFTPEATAADLEIAGYNVYRDGVRLNETLLTGCDLAVTDAEHTATYNVTAVYTGRGESHFSNGAIASESGIYGISADAVKVSAGRSVITVSGAEGIRVDVYTADGRAVASRIAADTENISIAAGVYIVRAGSASCKVVVK